MSLTGLTPFDRTIHSIECLAQRPDGRDGVEGQTVRLSRDADGPSCPEGRTDCR
jgi:hypothetical protein